MDSCRILGSVVQHIHTKTRYRRVATLQWIQKYIRGSILQKTIQQGTQNCMICAKNNPKSAIKPPRWDLTLRNPPHQALAGTLYSNVLSPRKSQIPANVCGHLFRMDRSISCLDRKASEVAIILLKEISLQFE